MQTQSVTFIKLDLYSEKKLSLKLFDTVYLNFKTTDTLLFYIRKQIFIQHHQGVYTKQTNTAFSVCTFIILNKQLFCKKHKIINLSLEKLDLDKYLRFNVTLIK